MSITRGTAIAAHLVAHASSDGNELGATGRLIEAALDVVRLFFVPILYQARSSKDLLHSFVRSFVRSFDLCAAFGLRATRRRAAPRDEPPRRGPAIFRRDSFGEAEARS